MQTIKVYKNRQVILQDNDAGTQYENLATTYKFEFPEFVNKNGIDIATSTLNKYIIFDIGNENTDLIIDDTYTIPYAITKLGRVIAYLCMKEQSQTNDIADKLIWISDGFLLTFDNAIETNIEITNEKVDAFNTLYTELNLKIIEVDNLKAYIEQFKSDVEAGLYNGKSIEYNWDGTKLGIKREDESEYEYVDLKGEQGEQGIQGEQGEQGEQGIPGQDGYTPQRGVDYFTTEDIELLTAQIKTNILQSQEFTSLQQDVSSIKNDLDNNTMLIIEKGD